ncbi:hypothetical protein, partial [Streptomyces botrytidirepellens]
MATTPDYLTQYVSHVTAELKAHDIPLVIQPTPRPPDPNGWSTYTPPINRTRPAWCTAVLMLADHHHTPLIDHIPTADAIIKDHGIRGLAVLHRDLAGGPVDYRFTPCPYCQGVGEDPTQPTCESLRCPVSADISDHPHGCPVCRAADCDPDSYAEQQMHQVEQLLIEALIARTPPPHRRPFRR